MRRVTVLVVLLALAVPACGLFDRGASPDPVSPETTTTTATTIPTTTTTTQPRVCDAPVDPPPAHIDVSDTVTASVVISRATFICSDVVALVPHGDPGAAIAAAHELDGRGPTLVVDGPIEPDTMAELRRLAPKQILSFGLALTAVDGLDAEISTHTADGTPPPLGRLDHPAGHLWLVHPDDSAALVFAAAAATGGSVVALPEGDLWSEPELVEAVGTASGVTVAASEPAGWQLEAIRSGNELPGGGWSLFPGRRLVALYGNPTTPFLGVLGEQPPAEGLERLTALAEGYGDDGLTVLPTFEIIVTVASARAGSDNDYSDEMAVDTLRPWIEFAAANDVYVVLDLQPGRTDFLTQAKYYEEFLRLPHVGLALDPEWRLAPNQVHLRQVGSVDAAEINRVSEWLAEIVRDEALPQKLFLVHQFKFSMITDRDSIETPPELAVVIQMDGQGPLGSKYGTFAAITDDTDDVGWRWGWKNFFDEDSPMASAADVLSLDPTVVFVSFQ